MELTPPSSFQDSLNFAYLAVIVIEVSDQVASLVVLTFISIHFVIIRALSNVKKEVKCYLIRIISCFTGM